MKCLEENCDKHICCAKHGKHIHNTFHIEEKKKEMRFFDQVFCRRCESKIVDCKCHPSPCPFCDKEFGFTQDWNVHLIEFHKIIERKKK